MKSDYRKLTTRECIEYIQKNKGDLENNNWDYSIPSEKGIIYTLPNGEFVLLPSNLKESYPGIIFKNGDIFKFYLAKDSFPIGEEDMSWFEANESKVQSLGKGGHSLYKDIPEVEDAYYRLLKFINEPLNDDKSKDAAVNLFGLSIIDFLSGKGNYTVRLQKRYAMYNPYYYPLLYKDGKYVDVLTDLEIALRMENKESFKFFIQPYQFSG